MTLWSSKLRSLVGSDRISAGQGASESEIAIAEERLGLRFPQELFRYFREFGYLSIGHFELFGLGAKVPSYLDLVRNTLDERTLCQPNIPGHLLPLMNNGGGDHYCADLSLQKADPPIVFWNHELDGAQEPELEADSFSSWIISLLEIVFALDDGSDSESHVTRW